MKSYFVVNDLYFDNMEDAQMYLYNYCFNETFKPVIQNVSQSEMLENSINFLKNSLEAEEDDDKKVCISYLLSIISRI